MLFLLLCGMLFARKFRKVIAFAGGFGTGAMLSMAVASFLVEGDIPAAFLSPGAITPMDLLAGLEGDRRRSLATDAEFAGRLPLAS